MPFAGGSCRVKTSQYICFGNHLTGFCMLWISTERYLRMDYFLLQLIQSLSEECSSISNHCELFYNNM